MSKKQKRTTKESEKSLNAVPPDFRERFNEIVALTDTFCNRFLNDEYRQVCRKMAACLCQTGSPVLTGKADSWACGLAYSVGKVNFLTDPTQTPHMKGEEVAKGFGVSAATMHSKSRVIWNGLDLMQFDPNFTVGSLVSRNPLIWMLRVNGIEMDIRFAPREAQEVAFEQGLIPYIPADRGETE